ncbi:serine/threonine protein kinase [Frigoriglobus tundricola]|nr:serine/threonine-protein kinase [Frigoriglobus tundricola]
MSGATGTGQRACPDVAELAAFLSDKLPPDTMDEIGAHVSSCRHCDAAVRRMDGVTSGTLDSLPGRGGADARVLVPTKCLPAGPLPSAPPPPVQLGQYRIGERLGQGGMGAVYRAEHVRLKKSVAVKVLAPGQVRDPRAVARFQLEMEVVGRLDHPNIVRATDAGEADGTHFLVMELIDGVNLAHLLLQRGPLPVPTACELVRQAALGLQHAHEHGLVHRDVKPSNLMLTPSGQVKLLDLGLALLRNARPLGGDLTGVGEVMGTAEYMAPEQYAETRSVDTRADVYSLGCTLYALLTGDPPFAGAGRNSFLRMMWAHQHEGARPVAELRADVPPALGDLLARMLSKNPDDRPATPSAVAAALEPLAAGAHLSGLSASVPVQPGATDRHTPVRATPRLQARSDGPPATGPRRRWRGGYVAGLAIGAAVIGAGAYFAAPVPPRSNQEPEPSAELPPEPGKWHVLLSKRPVERLWVPTTESFIHYQQDKELLTVQSARHALIRLGETSAKGYKLQVGFRQIPWQGGFGIYFGGRPNAARNVFEFQTLFLLPMRPSTPERQFSLRRGRGEFALDHGGELAKAGVSRHEFATNFFPAMDVGEHLLELEVRSSNIFKIRWSGVDCEDLINLAAENHARNLFPDKQIAGEFGIYCNGSTTTVTTARYISIE